MVPDNKERHWDETTSSFIRTGNLNIEPPVYIDNWDIDLMNSPFYPSAYHERKYASEFRHITGICFFIIGLIIVNFLETSYHLWLFFYVCGAIYLVIAHNFDRKLEV